MAEAKVEGDALKKLVKLGKRQPMAFAFNPGPKNDHTMVVDRRKKAEVIAKQAKKEGAGNKVAFGTFVLNKKTMELTCERTIPAMAKVLKKYLKAQKVVVNVVIMDAQGNVLESEIEDLPEDPSMDDDDADFEAETEDAPADAAPSEAQAEPETGADAKADAQAAPPQQDRQDAPAEDGKAEAEPAQESKAEADPAGDRAALASRLKAVQPAISGAQDAVAAKLKKAAAMAVAQIKSGDLAAADKTVTAIEKAVARLGDAPSGAAAQTPPQDRKAGEDPQAAGPDLRALAARAGALKEVIVGMQGAPGEKLTNALGSAARMLKAGDLAGAEILLGRIEAAVNKVSEAAQADTAATDAAAQADAPPAPEDAAGAAKWQAAEARIQPEVDRLMQEKRGDLAAINRFFNYAKDQAEAGVFDKALAAAARTEALIKQAAELQGSSAAQEAEAAIPHNVVAYTKTRLAWIRTRGDLRKDLESLKSAIDKTVAGIEGLEQVPAKSGVLFDYLDDIDTSLEETLEKLVETADGDGREKLKAQARKIIEDYRGVLDTDFFKAVDKNGFANTSIRASALASLKDVSAALET